MKRIVRLFSVIFTLLIFTACANEMVKDTKRLFTDTNAKYNNVIATFVTTQGDISFYLYPEASPLTVANFINLAKRGFYDHTKFNRAVENFVVQGGDPTGTGSGGPGYTIPDEHSDWLDFFQYGMLAMANAGPNTGGSQFFFTLYPADWLNGLHTIFGEIKSEADFQRLRKLEVGDVIKEIKFEGDVDLILSLNKQQVEEWNAILDKTYPNLKKYPIAKATPEQIKAYQEEIDRIYTKEDRKKSSQFEYPIPRLIRAIGNALSPKKEV